MFPSTLIKTPNPLFDYESSQIRWLSDPKQLKRYTLTLLVLAFILSAVIALVVRDIPFIFNVGQRRGAAGRVFFDFTNFLTDFNTVAGIAIGFYYMYVALRGVNQDVNSGKWDGLRLTMIGEDNLVWAKYAVAQMRVWRYMVLYIGLQVLVAMFAFLMFRNFNNFNNPNSANFGLPDSVLIPWFLARIVSLFQAIVVPLWMMQALTALGLVIGLQIRQLAVGLLAIFFAIVTLEVSQIGLTRILGLVSRMMTFTIAQYNQAQYNAPPGRYAGGFGFSDRFYIDLAITVLSLATSFAVYKIVQQIGLRMAFRAARHVEPLA